MNNYFLILGLILFAYMNFWFIVSLIKKRNDVADIAWGLGFVMLAWVSYGMGNMSTIGLIVSSLVTLWGVRLALHIYKRNRNKTEDPRYLEWRNAWGAWFYIRSYFQVYILQGILLYMISLSVLMLNQSSFESVGVLTVIGLSVWALGFFFEAVGDRQLANFIKNPDNKGKLMMSGLWAYTRHPNYFGEVTQWWGIWLIVVSLPFGIVAHAIALISPLTISVLILKVSGIPMLEKRMASHPDFAEYKRKVSIFIPLPSKK